jgi:hypothetical protein
MKMLQDGKLPLPFLGSQPILYIFVQNRYEILHNISMLRHAQNGIQTL